MCQVPITDGHCLHICMHASLRATEKTSSTALSFLSVVFLSDLSSPGLSPPSYSFTPAPAVLSAEAAAALYPPMGQVLLSPRPLLPGHPYYPASAQLYMNYAAYYPR